MKQENQIYRDTERASDSSGLQGERNTLVEWSSARVTTAEEAPIQDNVMFLGERTWSDAILGRGQVNPELKVSWVGFISGLPVLKSHSDWVTTTGDVGQRTKVKPARDI